MNHFFRSIWNAALEAWVAVAENARAHGKRGNRRHRAALISALLAAVPVHPALAVSLTWDANGAAAGGGGNGTWDTTSLQWQNGAVYGPWGNSGLDDAVFGLTTGGAVTVSATINVHNVTVNTTYSFTGGVLNLSGLDPTVSVVGNNIGNLGTTLSGTSGLIKTGTGILNLQTGNTYTGVTQLRAGTLTLGTPAALGLNAPDASNLLVSGGTNLNLLNGTYARDFTAVSGGSINITGGSSTWAGSPTLLASTQLNFLGGMTVSGDLADTGVNMLSVTAGTGTTVFSGNNSYSGPTTLTGTGMLVLNSVNALSSQSNLTFSGTAGSTSGIVLGNSGNFTRELGAGPNQVRWVGSGGFSANGANRFVDLGGVGATVTWGQGGFVPAGGSLNLATSSPGNAEIDFRNPIDLDGATRVINAGMAGRSRLSGVLSNGGVTYQGNGQITTSALNLYSGVTTINGVNNPSTTTVNVGFIGDGGVAGNLGMASSAASNIVLNGGVINYIGAGEVSNRGLTFGNLPSSGITNSGTGSLTLTGNVVGNGGMLRLGAASNNGLNALEGLISGTGGIARFGPTVSFWRLGNVANTYTGVTDIQSGILDVPHLANGGLPSSIGASSNAAANLRIGNTSTFRYSGTGDTTDRAFTGAGGVLNAAGTGPMVWTSTAPIEHLPFTASSTLILTGENTGGNTLSASLRDSSTASNANALNAGLVKNGGGVWILNATGQGYSGNTQLNAGVLYAGTASAITGGMALDALPSPTSGYTSTSPLSSLIQFSGGVLGLTAGSGDFERSLTVAARSFNDNGNNGGASPNFADDSFIHAVRWFGSGGFAALGGTRTVDLGGSGAGVTWGTGGFVPTGSTLIFGAALADSTVDFVNPIALEGIAARTVLANDGSAAIDGMLSGALTGAGSLVKTGAGTLALAADNSYAGTTTVQVGTLQVGNNGTTGSLGAGNVTLGKAATIAFARTNAYEVANTITGAAGTLVQAGTGTTTLTAARNVVDATVVATGTLEVSDTLLSNTLLIGTGSLVVGRSFETATGGTVAMSNVTGTSSTLLVNGTARVNGDMGDGVDRVAVAGGATLDVGAAALLLGDGSDELAIAGKLTGSGGIDLGLGGDVFAPNSNFDASAYAGVIDGGTGAGEVDTLMANNFNTGAAIVVPGARLANFEKLDKLGPGAVTLTGAQGYAQGTTIFDGALNVEGTLETPTVGMSTGTTLDVKAGGLVQAAPLTPGGPPERTTITGGPGGETVHVGAGGALRATGDLGDGNDVLFLEGAFDPGPGTLILGPGDDILRFGGGADTSALAIPLSGGTGANEIQADIAAGGSATMGSTDLFQKLTKTGAGALRIAGTASEVGTVDVRAGTLEIMAPGGGAPGGSLTGAKTTTVAAGATLQVDHLYSATAGDDTVTMAGNLSGTGTVDLQGGNDVFRLDSSGTISPTLTLLNGNDGVDTFVLGGTGNALFDVGQLGAGMGTANPKPGTGAVLQKAGAAIQNFEILRKEGAGVWTLTGLADATQNWTIAEGTLVGNTDSLQGKINNQATLVFDQAADGVYANSLSGTGRMFKRGAGMLDLTGDSPMSGPTTVEQGRLQVTGAISSPVAVEAGGILGGTGVVRGAVTNAGVVAPGTAGAMGTLTIQGDYAGNGGQLAMRTVLGGSASPADRLVIDGGHISGTTPVAVAPQGGSGVLTEGLGINVVSLVNGATQADKSFTLGAPVVIGPFQYDLVQAASAQESGWYLRSRDKSPLAPVASGGGPLPREIAATSPEVSLNSSLGAMTQLYGVESLGTLQSRGGLPEERVAYGAIHAWTRAFGSHGRLQGGGLQARGADFSYDTAGLQAGADMQVHQDDTLEDRVGGYAGIGRLGADVKHVGGTEAGHNSLRAYSVGAYWTRSSQEGWYVDTVAQYTRYDRVRTASVQGIQGRTRGWGVAASVEGGMSLPLQEGPRDRVSIEPQAQLIVQRTQLDDVRDSYLNEAKLGGGHSVLGRVGTRLVRKWYDAGAGMPSSSAWARVNLWQEFAGRTNATYQTPAGPLAYGSRLRGTWAELELGFSTALTPSMSLQGSVSYQRSLSGMRREGASLNAAGNADATALLGAGVGLSTRLSPNATLRTRASYGAGARGQAQAAATVDLDLRW